MNAPPLIILDTNVVLDCFVFRNVGCQALRQALDCGAVQAVGTSAMRDELSHVLGRGLSERWQADASAVLARWDGHVQLLPEAPASRMLCTDRDDQKFIDLALAHRVPWLLTRDRAVLKLARRARMSGVAIIAPDHWDSAERPV